MHGENDLSSPPQCRLKTSIETEPAAEPLLPESDEPKLQCIFSPRTHAILTNDGNASDGLGIVARLEAEVRRRAFAQWDATGNTSVSENWFSAERSVLKTVEVSKSDSQSILELQKALHAKEC